MSYKAVQADASYINEFNYPLLAHIKQPGVEYLHILYNPTEWERKKDISDHWSGVVVFPEKKSGWYNVRNDAYNRNSIIAKIIIAALSCAAFALFALSVYQLRHFLLNLFGLLSLAGVLLSIAVLRVEIGIQS